MNNSLNSINSPKDSATSVRFLVYAILGDETKISRETLGPDFRDLIEVVEFEELRIAVQAFPVSQCQREADAERLQQFSDVLSELQRLGDILPFRFGTIVAAEDLPKFFAPQKETLLHALTKIAGCVEINIRWAVPEEKLNRSAKASHDPDGERMSGFNYLKDKLQSKQHSEHVESLLSDAGVRIQQLVGDACVAQRTSVRSMRTVCPDREIERVYSIARLDLLIRRSAYHQVMQTASAIVLSGVRPTLISGPWPTFSFVETCNSLQKENSLLRQESLPRNWLEVNA